MGRGLVLSLRGGIRGWGIAVCYSTHLSLCDRGSWGYGLGWFVASWTLGVGGAGGGVTRPQLCSFSFFSVGLLCTVLFTPAAAGVCVSVIA